LDVLRDTVKGVDNYKDILKDVPDPEKDRDDNRADSKSIDDFMYEEECARYELAWDQGS
jgi:V-type H+-transporting ATPase subunit d